MRFVLISLIYLAWAAPAFAQPGNVVPRSQTATNKPINIQLSHNRSASDRLQTTEQFHIEEIVTGLGSISALTAGPDSSLYSLDQTSGRIWKMVDRDKDGIPDRRRAIDADFIKPTGLTIVKDILFIADIEGVWRYQDGKKYLLAPLTQSGSRDNIYHLSKSPDEQSLILSFTKESQQSTIVSVNIISGRATVMSSGAGPIDALAVLENGTLWLSAGGKIGVVNTAVFSSDGWTGFGNLGPIQSLWLPDGNHMPADWPAEYRNHILAAQAGNDAYHLIAIPTEFGVISDDATVIADGFLSRSGRQSWGEPGALYMDQRGLFIADSWRGSIWRLSPAPPKPIADIKIVAPETKDPAANSTESSPENPVLGLSAVTSAQRQNQGSQIGETASGITGASTIDTGSTIIKAYNEKKALEADKEAKEKDKKSVKKPSHILD